MREIRCDVAVVGAGSAGLAARAAAAREGADTLLIEAGPGGTTCARVGCMPSKLLIAAADAAHATTRLGTFGLRLDGALLVDGPAVMGRLRRERDSFVAATLGTVEHIPAEKKLTGTARFGGPTTLLVGDATRVEARAVVIATGSRPSVPDELKALGDLVLTTDSIFEIADLPGSLAVIGAGPLGIELGLAFARLGTRVTVLDKATGVGGIGDPEVSRVATDLLGRELDLKLGATFGAERVADGARLTWRSPGGNGSATFDLVLAAAGRPPNLDGLDLPASRLALDEHGVPLFDRSTMRCGESAVFIAGDADHDAPILHEASFEGAIAGRNAARFPKVEPGERATALSVVYTDPEIATVGGGWAKVGDQDPAVGSTDLRESGRARVLARNAGLIRVYASKSDGRLLGGEMIGPDIEHIAHLLAWAVQRGLAADEVLALPFYHPTIEESLRSAIRELCGAVNTRPTRRSEDLEFGPGG